MRTLNLNLLIISYNNNPMKIKLSKLVRIINIFYYLHNASIMTFFSYVRSYAILNGSFCTHIN